MPLKKKKKEAITTRKIRDLEKVTNRVNSLCSAPIEDEVSTEYHLLQNKKSLRQVFQEQNHDAVKNSGAFQQPVTAMNNFSVPESRQCATVLQTLPMKEKEDLKTVYDLFTDPTGLMSFHNFERALRFLRFKFQQKQLLEALRSLLDDGCYSKLNFNTFCACVTTLGNEWRDFRKEIDCGFKKFDFESKGRITLQNLKFLNKRHSLGLTNQELSEMLNEVDSDGDGVIKEEEFIKFMSRLHLFT